MEGNACYKFSTIRNYVLQSRAAPIRTALDIGANVGTVTREMASYFPDCHIYGFEAVTDYFDFAFNATHHLPNVKMFNVAITSQHRFEDECGNCRRYGKAPLKILKGLPAAGPGWSGGSQVQPSEASFNDVKFEHIAQPVIAVTLDEIVDMARKLDGNDRVDLVKFDCEGCERSSIGCADIVTLRRIRFIVGEYHDLDLFYRVLKERLFKTHHVNIIGDASLGAFFAENIEEGAGILRPDRTGMLAVRPWLGSSPMEWNLFDGRFVTPGEEGFHAL